MKLCPTCRTQYPEDANFCPQESCATADGPQRLQVIPSQPPARFQPSERLGGGRTGEVWRARDAQSGNEVAYKVVAAEVVPTAALLARAEREFKQLMRVASPKIASIVDCEKTSAGGLGVAMELCSGDSLERILAAGSLSFEQAKAITSQVGLALLEAQKVGLVHRDVSPKNILVSTAGDVKVINFPLAKPINDRVAGVAAYLSPEQVQGKPVDQRSNTYSLAAILYHMITGEPPFQAPSEQAVLEMHISTPVLPASQRRPGLKIPADTDKLLLKALDKSSSRRHLTLRLFLNELEALKDQPAGASKPAGEAALAKTMMFGGNQADIARMVAEARAAKAAGTSVPALQSPAAPAVAAPPPQVAQPASFQMGPTIAVGAASPAAAPHIQPQAVRPSQHGASAGDENVPTPPPASPHAQMASPQAPVAKRPPTPGPVTPPLAQPARPAQQPAQPVIAQQPAAAIKPHEAGKGPPPKAGAAFRETLWFKQGDVEQLVADAKAKMQAAGKGTGDAPIVADDARPLEDRYADDGSVTVEDRKKFSLRTGGTATALPAAGGEIPGERMNESEMVGEISGGRRTLILVVAGVVILALIVVIVLVVRGKGKDSDAEHGGEQAAKVAPAKKPELPSVPAAQSGQAGQLGIDAGAPSGTSSGVGSPSAKPRGIGLGASPGPAPKAGAPASSAKAGPSKKVARKKAAARHGGKRRSR